MRASTSGGTRGCSRTRTSRSTSEVEREVLVLEHPRVPPLVDALIEKRLLELVRRQEPHEVAVAELVDRHVADRGVEHLAAADRREERLVLHAAGFERI